jgi:hypothetical protein
MNQFQNPEKFFHWHWSQFQNPMVSPLALEFLSLKSLSYKDLRLAKHPKFKVAFPKTEVLGKPHWIKKNASKMPDSGIITKCNTEPELITVPFCLSP